MTVVLMNIGCQPTAVVAWATLVESVRWQIPSVYLNEVHSGSILQAAAHSIVDLKMCLRKYS